MQPKARTFEGTSRFAVSRKLGEGGMGVVYEAHDRDRGIPVALKTLLHLSPNGLLLFKQEFRSVAGIVHPNLISLHELFAEGEVWFFTMEMLHGRNLIEALRAGCSSCEFSTPKDISSDATEDRLSATISAATSGSIPSAFPPGGQGVEGMVVREPVVRGSAPNADALRHALLQVAQGLLAVHTAGKLHRDIKPSNILVTPEGRAVVLDFGLAQELGTSDGAGRGIAGTLAYMSPEQAVNRTLTPATDWYALGVTLYQSLTGSLPFVGKATPVLEAKRRRALLPPSELAVGVDPELEALTMDLLHPDPWRRPGGDAVVARLSGSNVVRLHAATTQPKASGTNEARPLFVGREAENDKLREALTRADTGEAVFVTVHGSSGVGKTALVDHFLESAPDKTVVLRGRCYEQESVPYKAVDSAVDALCQQLLRFSRSRLASLIPENMAMLAKLFPVLRRLEEESPWPEAASASDPRQARRLAIAALRELLRRLAQRRKIILVIDDLQWGDTDSATLLADMLAAPDPPPMLVLCTYRAEYAARSLCLQTLLPALAENSALHLVEIPLAPLSATEARTFAAQLMGENRSEAIAQVVADSGGSPYLMKELADYVSARPAESAAGVSLNDALASRFAGLAPDAQRLLEVIAVHGLPLAQIDAYRAAQLAGRDPAPLAALRFANLIRSSGTAETDEVEAYHDRVRETVVAHLATDSKRDRHSALAATLEQSGRADAETLASHFEGAGDNQRAGELFETAAGRAEETLAFDRAASFYQRSLRLRQLGPTAELSLRLRLAEALANARGGVDAAKGFEDAARLADPSARLALERRAAFYYMSCGRIEEGRAVLERVMKRAQLWLPQSRGAVLALLAVRSLRLALRSAHFREQNAAAVPHKIRERFDAAYAIAAPMGLMDGAQGLSFGALCLLLALRAGDPVRLVYGLQVGGYGMTLQGARGRRRAAALLDTARRISAERRDARLDATVALSSASQAYVIGQWRRSLELFAEAEHLYSKCPGTHWELASVRTLRLYTLFSLGEFAALAREYGPALQEAQALDDRYSCASLEAFCQPMALLAQDRVSEARHAVEASLGRWMVQQHGLQQVMAAQSLNAASFYDGTAANLTGYMQEQWKLLGASGMGSFDNLRISWLERMARTGLAHAGRSNASPEERKLGLTMARNAHRQLKKESLPWSFAVTNQVEAGLLAAAGDRAGAAGLLLKVIEQFSAVEMRANEASCRLYAGYLVGGERGKEMEASARQWFASQSIVNADRMAAVHAGGVLPHDATKH